MRKGKFKLFYTIMEPVNIGRLDSPENAGTGIVGDILK